MGVAIIVEDMARFANPSMARMGLWIDEKASMAFVNPETTIRSWPYSERTVS
jgi:hypothetical protein